MRCIARSRDVGRYRAVVDRTEEDVIKVDVVIIKGACRTEHHPDAIRGGHRVEGNRKLLPCVIVGTRIIGRRTDRCHQVEHRRVEVARGDVTYLELVAALGPELHFEAVGGDGHLRAHNGLVTIRGVEIDAIAPGMGLIRIELGVLSAIRNGGLPLLPAVGHTRSVVVALEAHRVGQGDSGALGEEHERVRGGSIGTATVGTHKEIVLRIGSEIREESSIGTGVGPIPAGHGLGVVAVIPLGGGAHLSPTDGGRRGTHRMDQQVDGSRAGGTYRHEGMALAVNAEDIAQNHRTVAVEHRIVVLTVIVCTIILNSDRIGRADENIEFLGVPIV